MRSAPGPSLEPQGPRDSLPVPTVVYHGTSVKILATRTPATTILDTYSPEIAFSTVTCRARAPSSPFAWQLRHHWRNSVLATWERSRNNMDGMRNNALRKRLSDTYRQSQESGCHHRTAIDLVDTPVGRQKNRARTSDSQGGRSQERGAKTLAGFVNSRHHPQHESSNTRWRDRERPGTVTKASRPQQCGAGLAGDHRGTLPNGEYCDTLHKCSSWQPRREGPYCMEIRQAHE